MVTSKDTLEKIRNIIKNNFANLLISLAGGQVYSAKEREELKKEGVNTDRKKSLLSLAYFHNYLNQLTQEGVPTTAEEMEVQQQAIGEFRTLNEEAAEDMINADFRTKIEKLQADVSSRLLSIISENNEAFRRGSLQVPGRSAELEKLIKESTLAKLKTQLRDTTGDANRDWNRVVVTEISDIIGMGSVDRILSQNPEKAANDIIVYRIIVDDEATCKWCRRFYQDSKGEPQLYRLSELLNNGSNYGKSKDSWKPVTGATHPNTRTSQIIELKPGWEVLPGGRQHFMGFEDWQAYISKKLKS